MKYITVVVVAEGCVVLEYIRVMSQCWGGGRCWEPADSAVVQSSLLTHLTVVPPDATHHTGSWRMTKPGHHKPTMELLVRNSTRHANLEQFQNDCFILIDIADDNWDHSISNLYPFKICLAPGTVWGSSWNICQLYNSGITATCNCLTSPLSLLCCQSSSGIYLIFDTTQFSVQ